MRRASLIPLFALALAAAPAGAENVKKPADDAPAKPFTIVVMGDSLADGLWGSLYRHYVKARTQVAVKRHAVNSAGFTAYNFEAQLEKIVAKETIDLLVFMVGANDRQRAFAVGNSREWAALKTEKWHHIYRSNVQRFLALIQAKKIPMVWVGLPIMSKETANADSRLLNGIYRELSAAHGVTFVDIWAVTANKQGEFDSFIADEQGRKRRYRHDDGIHFSDIGYDHVARYVLRFIRERHPQFQRLWSVSGP